jgi:hypothetical protein
MMLVDWGMLRKFRSRSEDKMQRQIRAAVERHGAEMHEKVRIADLIDISQLDQRGLGSYALQAHFDFVLIDVDQEAIAAIEFDGSGHDPSNDLKKDLICQRANLPLIRVYGFEQVRQINAMTLIRYLVELVFHAKIFLQMQKEGKIRHDEPFMLSGFLKSDAKHVFDSEFNFVGNTSAKLTKALRKGELTADPFPHLSISRLMARSPDEGRLRAYISINSSKGPLIGSASLRVALPSPGFLADIGTLWAEIAQFAEGMAADDLLEGIRLIAGGHSYIVSSAQEILAEIATLAPRGYTLVMGGGGSSSDANLMGAFAEGKAGKPC